jgi:hypothetical protein
MAASRKLQIVLDPLTQDCLTQIKGETTKTDKIRWALCVYVELLRALKTDAQMPADQILANAGTRYRRIPHTRKV